MEKLQVEWWSSTPRSVSYSGQMKKHLSIVIPIYIRQKDKIFPNKINKIQKLYALNTLIKITNWHEQLVEQNNIGGIETKNKDSQKKYLVVQWRQMDYNQN